MPSNAAHTQTGQKIVEELLMKAAADLLLRVNLKSLS